MLRDFGDPTQSASNPISVVSIATGRSVSLGTGDQVAGDPAAEGVFASLTAPPAGQPRCSGQPRCPGGAAGRRAPAGRAGHGRCPQPRRGPGPQPPGVARRVPRSQRGRGRGHRPARGGRVGWRPGDPQPVRPDHRHAARPRRDGTRPGRPGLVGVRPGAGLPERQHQRCTGAERLVRGRPHLSSTRSRRQPAATARACGHRTAGRSCARRAAGRNGSSSPRPAGRPPSRAGPGFPWRGCHDPAGRGGARDAAAGRDHRDDPGRGPGGHRRGGRRAHLLPGRPDLDPARHRGQRGVQRPRVRGQRDRCAPRPARPAGARGPQPAGPWPGQPGRPGAVRPARRGGRDLPDLSAVPDADPAGLAERRLHPAPDQRPLPGGPGTSAGQPQDGRSDRLAPRPAGALRRLAGLHDHRAVPGARPGPRVLVRPGLDLLLGHQPDRCLFHSAGHPGAGPPAAAGPRGRG